MASTSKATTTPKTFDDVYNHLKSLPAPLLPPAKVHDASLPDTIASLYVHPTLEALLHILNLDLPSAHFLVRKMQSAPAHEGMYIHGLLHRIEGDINNSRAWYFDVASSDVFTNFYGPYPEDPATVTSSTNLTYKEDKFFNEEGQKVPPQQSARDFLNAVEALQKTKKGDKDALEKRSREEIDALVKFCVAKFGKERMDDASGAYVKNSEEINEISENMVSGSGGHRKF